MSKVKSDKLYGVWRMISYKASAENKEQVDAKFWGDNPGGRIVYTPEGHMFVTVHHGGRPMFSGNDPKTATIEQARECLEKYCTYYGTYTFDEDQQIIHHYIDGHIWPIFQRDPNDDLSKYPEGTVPPGGPYLRTVDFDGDNLVLGYLVEHTLEDADGQEGSGGGSVIKMAITWVRDESFVKCHQPDK